jgi:purine-binding chemotaxis protein CheW
MQYCTFYLDDKHYGVPMMKVQEVIHCQSLTPVPLASRIVKGLMNLRGSIVLSVDLRRRLGLADQAADQPSLQIITNGPSGLVGWIVDRMGEVRELDPALGETPPGTIPGENRDLIAQVFSLDRGLLMVLEADRILEMEQERSEKSWEGSQELV